MTIWSHNKRKFSRNRRIYFVANVRTGNGVLIRPIVNLKSLYNLEHNRSLSFCCVFVIFIYRSRELSVERPSKEEAPFFQKEEHNTQPSSCGTYLLLQTLFWILMQFTYIYKKSIIDLLYPEMLKFWSQARLLLGLLVAMLQGGGMFTLATLLLSLRY